MSVKYTGVDHTLDANTILYHTNNTIAAITQAAIVSMAEANVDIILDQPELYASKDAVEPLFQNLHTQAVKMVNAAFDMLKQAVLT